MREFSSFQVAPAGSGRAAPSPHTALLVLLMGGFTDSTDFPITPGAFQSTLAGGSLDVFITGLDSSGSAIVYSTYLGGSRADEVWHLAIDATGNAYLGGLTDSTDFPTTLGAFQTSYAGGVFDAFVTKLNPSGSALVYSTYLGGGGDDVGLGVTLDTLANAYMVEGPAQVSRRRPGHSRPRMGAVRVTRSWRR